MDTLKIVTPANTLSRATRPPAVSTFDPAADADALFYLTAAAGLGLSGTDLESLTDQTAGLVLTQGTQSDKPVYLAGPPPAFSVNGAKRILGSGVIAAADQNYTLAVVLTPSATSGNKWFWNARAGDSNDTFTLGIISGQWGWFDGTNRLTGVSATTARQLLVFDLASSGAALYRNGLSVASALPFTPLAMDGDLVFLGRYNADDWFAGTIEAFWIGNRKTGAALTQFQNDLMELFSIS